VLSRKKKADVPTETSALFTLYKILAVWSDYAAEPLYVFS